MTIPDIYLAVMSIQINSVIAYRKNLEIDGFVDDYRQLPCDFAGKAVIRSEALPDNALVLNCSSSIFPVSAYNKIASLPVAAYMNAADLYRFGDEHIPLPDFVAAMRHDYETNAKHWESLLDLIEEAESKQVIKDIIQFRLTGDSRIMNAYSFRPHDQYFEDFLNFGPGEVFVDGGGYTGDTAEEFCKRVPEYGKIFLFEPSEANITAAKQRLKDKNNIEFIQQGLSHSSGTLRFNPDNGSASSVAEEGSVEISVTTIDESIHEKTTFIKTDLEGWDIEALKGAQRHILEYHPKLAISVYHQAADFWRIPEYVLGLRDDYEIRLRHYTEGWSETIMFFLPKA